MLINDDAMTLLSNMEKAELEKMCIHRIIYESRKL